ncbi:MAG: hypothetical protein BroJett018_28830 [Chloroflexota bacterium]|nr:MAG: hypothetical protein BroJett018_28830 [Chloroflexota bacterium]
MQQVLASRLFVRGLFSSRRLQVHFGYIGMPVIAAQMGAYGHYLFGLFFGPSV